MRELDQQPLTGEFNSNHFVTVPSAGKFDGFGLLRIPQTNKDMMENLIDEYRRIGFTRLGGRVRRRTPEEQYLFSQNASSAGLRVLAPLERGVNSVTYPFLGSAKRLDDYLDTHPQEIDTLTYTLLQDLHKAHRKGFSYGDRWAGNILIDPKRGLTHIDFDLELSGPPVRELDVAQVAYHTLASSKGEALPILGYMLGTQKTWFDHHIMQTFLRGLSHFLKDTKVGGLEDTTEELIGVIQTTRTTHKKR